MLVLSRKCRQSVVIGGADGLHRLLKVTVLDIRGTQVRLGFDVDADIPVHRLEVWERINEHSHVRQAECLTKSPRCRLGNALSTLRNESK